MNSNTLTEPTPAIADVSALYPLRFEPIFQYRLWGGQRLAHVLAAPLPGDEPIGEAWLLSDREDHPSVVADGALKGQTIQQLMQRWPEQLLGKFAGRFSRFPLLLKFLDAQQVLSVQVHPSDQMAQYIPPGESGKTEAWVVLEAGANGRVYAGLKSGTTPQSLQQAIDHHAVAGTLASFKAAASDAVFIQAGTMHSLCDLVVFEIQQNSDVTYRLDDWDRVDAKTGESRPLQVKQAMACIDFGQVAISPVVPVIDESTPLRREGLFDCAHFRLSRVHANSPFMVGKKDSPSVLVCIEGAGQIEYHGIEYTFNKGDVMLLPSVLGMCIYHPHGAATLLEISLPEGGAKP